MPPRTCHWQSLALVPAEVAQFVVGDAMLALRISTWSTVAVLSPRAREGAPVSMPLTWAQVRGDLDPKRYTVRTVPALLGKTKAWEGYDDAASSIRAAIKKLAAGR